MTDPTGRSFISYRRSRSGEVSLLIGAHRDRGIPTWQDVSDLDEAPLEDELRKTIDDPGIANAVLWITPDVAGSDVIRRVEYPAIASRARVGDSFFVLPCAAGGASYEAAAAAVDEGLVPESLADWNMQRVERDPINSEDAAAVARRVLARRLRAIDSALAPGEALRLGISCRGGYPAPPGLALDLDWTSRFEGRRASPGAWADILSPAIQDVANAIAEQCPARPIEAWGLPTISAAAMVGAAFAAPRGLELTWMQRMPPDCPDSVQPWSIRGGRTRSRLTTTDYARSTSSTGLAVLVSVAADVEPAFAASTRSMEGFRAQVSVAVASGLPHTIASADEARATADEIIAAIRVARGRYRPIETVHMFMAVPVGLALMIGQLLNTLGPVQLYEHCEADATGVYEPSARVCPTP